MSRQTFVPISHPQARASRRPVTMPVQAKTQEQDVDGLVRHSCSMCQITYYTPKRAKPQCPLCATELRVVELMDVITGLRNRVEKIEDENSRMRAQIEVTTAIKQAFDAIGSQDLVFLKTVLYRFRDDPTSIKLKVTHGEKGPNGFVALTKKGEPEGHYCSSVGGVAIAGYYEEVVHIASVNQAMAVLMRASGGVLAPGRDG